MLYSTFTYEFVPVAIIAAFLFVSVKWKQRHLSVIPRITCNCKSFNLMNL